jgi:hypothetical protein
MSVGKVIDMPEKIIVWKCADGVKFSTKAEADKHEKNDAFNKVMAVWFDGCIECPSDLVQWIQDHERLVYAVLDAASKH